MGKSPKGMILVKDKTLWTLVVVVSVLALLDWLGVGDTDLLRSVRGLGGQGCGELIGWALLGLVAYTVYRVVGFLTRS